MDPKTIHNLISIIITTHKRPSQMLRRAIDSVINQRGSYKTEIIVVDDAPDFSKHDEIKALIESYNYSIQYVINPKQGACISRNIGIHLAAGEYVAFLDDDDEWVNTKLEQMMPAFEPQVGMVYGRYNIANKGYIPTSNKQIYYQGFVFEQLLTKGNFVGGCSVPVLRKSCVEDVGHFDENLPSAQDWDLWLRLSKKYEIKFVNSNVVNYYISQNAITSNFEKKIFTNQYLLNKFQEDFRKYPLAYCKMLESQIYILFRIGQYQKAYRVCRQNKNIVSVRSFWNIAFRAVGKRILIKLKLQAR